MDQTKSTVYWLVGGSKDGRILAHKMAYLFSIFSLSKRIL